jgi:amidase
MGRTVADVAALLSAMAGSDPMDKATVAADAHKSDYAAGLDAGALKGVRLGVLRFATGYSAGTDAAFDAALSVLKAQGAELVDIDAFDAKEVGDNELTVLLTELKADMNAYLASTPATVKTRTLADLIAFNKATPQEMAWFGQDLFEKAEETKGLDDPDYLKARAASLKAAGPKGIDKLLADNKVVALIAPTGGPAWTIDLVNGDHFGGSVSALPAVAGYPHLTVPMGYVHGLPVGLSLIGPAWSEQRLLSLGYAYEQASRARRAPEYRPSIQLAPES